MTGSIAVCPAIARCLLALSLFSSGALADDAATPASHWSGLPIWGAEAEARGYPIPLPFGIGVTAYSARQPVKIQDLQLGFNGKDPVSVQNFLQIDIDRRHKADRHGILGQSGPAWHDWPLHGRGGLDRCDASEHPAEGRGKRCEYGSSIHCYPNADETLEHTARWPVRVRQGRLCSPRRRSRRSHVDPRSSCVPVLIG